MAGGDTLATVGEKVTDVFVHAFATGNSNVSLVFLPFALPTPDDIVQGGVVNPTRLAAFLVPNFDAPYLMSPSQYSVHGQDLYYGTASQIYRLAVTAARPTAPVGSDAWTRINSEIAMAQTMLSPAGVTPEFACVPDDWVLPDSTYWSTFDSTQAQTATPPQSTGRQLQLQRPVNPYLWAIKPAEQQDAPVQNLTYLHELSPALVAAATENAVPAAPAAKLNPAVLASIRLLAPAAQPSGADTAAVRQAIRVLPQVTPTSDVPRIRPYPIIWRGPIDPPPPPPPSPPPPTSNMSVSFKYMSATIGFAAAGVSTWDGVFLADPNWYVPGMPKGGLLPAPNVAVTQGDAAITYGLPIAIIVVKDLNISVQWSGQDQASLSGNGFVGPFSLAGASSTTSDGTWTYSRPGMQVVALLCSHLPVLPPADAPDLVQPATDAGPQSTSADGAATPSGADPAGQDTGGS